MVLRDSPLFVPVSRRSFPPMLTKGTLGKEGGGVRGRYDLTPRMCWVSPSPPPQRSQRLRSGSAPPGMSSGLSLISLVAEAPQRVAKFLAAAGVCSRRAAERLIAEGRV